MNLICSLYIGGVNTWSIPSLRRYDIINEWFFCSLTYFATIASDFVPNATLVYKMGWFYVGFIMIFIAVNLIPVLSGFANNMGLYCTYFYIRLQYCCGFTQKMEQLAEINSMKIEE